MTSGLQHHVEAITTADGFVALLSFFLPVCDHDVAYQRVIGSSWCWIGAGDLPDDVYYSSGRRFVDDACDRHCVVGCSGLLRDFVIQDLGVNRRLSS